MSQLKCFKHLFFLQTFLISVAKATTDFKTVNDILLRYEALVQAKKELAEKQERDLNALENARNDMVRNFAKYWHYNLIFIHFASS